MTGRVVDGRVRRDVNDHRLVEVVALVIDGQLHRELQIKCQLLHNIFKKVSFPKYIFDY